MENEKRKWLVRNDEMIPEYLPLECGATAFFDDESGCAYRCGTCGAVVGSVAMPKLCRELEEAAELARKSWAILKRK